MNNQSTTINAGGKESKPINEIGEEKYYNSPYPSEVTYKSDKNFLVRLYAMIDRKMKESGYSTSDEKFKSLINKFENAEKILFAQPPELNAVRSKEDGLDKALTEMGYNPEQLGERGIVFIRTLKENIELKAALKKEEQDHYYTRIAWDQTCAKKNALEEKLKQSQPPSQPQEQGDAVEWEQVFENAQTMHLQEFINYYSKPKQ